jgi:hypothetical protein
MKRQPVGRWALGFGLWALALGLGVIAGGLLLGGCESEPDSGYEPEESYHLFAKVAQHGEYLAANNYDFARCTECHGADLNGFETSEEGERARSCYNCHSDTTHQVGFNTWREHPDFIRSHNWDLSGCYHCHSATAVPQGTLSFGGSCSDQGCHISPNGPENCNVCHGNFGENPADTLSWAPPRDLGGRDSTGWIGVGAHRTHLEAGGDFAAIRCETCHEIPVGGIS